MPIFCTFAVCNRVCRIMKVQTAIISAVLITSRKRADGNYPIVIRVQFGGRAEKYLPHSVPLSVWDKKKQRVKSSYKSSSVINAAITREIAIIEQRKLRYEQNNTPYTAKTLLKDSKPIDASLLQYKALCERMLSIKRYEKHTVNMFNHSYNVLKDYTEREDFLITELTSVFCEGFVKWLKNTREVSNGTINVVLARIGALYKYGIEIGVIDEEKFPHPFKKFKYWQQYKIGNNRFGLNSDIMQILENDYINQCIYADGIQGIWWYKENITETLLHKRYSELFVQCLLLMCYKMQGIALCDLLRIKEDNISMHTIGDEEYYIFQGIHRKKTNESIDVISVKKTDSNAVMFECFIETMKERDGWFLPVLYNHPNIDSTVTAMTQLINKKIKKIFGRLGLDSDGVTYYTFRHTFASVYINEKQGNPVYLAQMMGRSVNNIFSYVNKLNNVESMIKEKERMD